MDWDSGEEAGVWASAAGADSRPSRPSSPPAATVPRREERRERISGTTQNDIIKEYLSRGTYVFAPGPSLRLITDMVAYTVSDIPKWNPINICSYHLQEAGATPEQELAFALATARAVLGLDPAFVATHQLMRFFGLALFRPLIARAFIGKV